MNYIEVEEGNPHYKSINGALCSNSGCLMCVPSQMTSFVIPNEITVIVEDAFNSSQIPCIIVPNTVKEIQGGAFNESKGNVLLATKLINFNSSSFDGCKNLYLFYEQSGLNKFYDGNLFYIKDLILTDVQSFLGCVNFRIENPVPECQFILHDVKVVDDILTPNEEGVYHFDSKPGNSVNGTVEFELDGVELTVGIGLRTAEPEILVSHYEYKATQTSLLVDVQASFDETMKPSEFGIYYYTSYPATENISEEKPYIKGKVKIEGLKPNKEYTLTPYAIYNGIRYSGERRSFQTYGTNPKLINDYVTTTSFKVTGKKNIDDAHLKEEYITVNKKNYPGHELELSGLNPGSSYRITYTVVTEEGSTETTNTTITTDPLELTILRPQPVSSTCAIVAAETNISEDETNVGFQWRKYDAPETLPSSEGYAAIYDGRLEGYIKNLQATSYYNVRAFYKTSDDKYYYSDWITFDPSDFSYFEPTVHTYPVDEVTEGTAKVKGYVLAGTDEITAQGFEYWPLGEDIAKAKTVSTAQTRAGGDVSVVMATGQVMTAELSNLQPGTTYCCRAFVTTVAGTTYGEEQTFTTQGTLTGVNTVTTEKAEPVIIGYYDLGGRKLNKPQRGSVTIVKYSDGTAKKAIFK